MSCISEYLAQGHRHCDDLFVSAENDVAEGRIAEAQTSHDALRLELETHFSMEEEIMFPAFENRTGMSAGPTEVMRMEHAQMRELLGRMTTALAEEDAVTYLGLSETLLMVMQQHNFKEEQMLYPMADEVLGASGETIVENMKVLADGAR